MVTLGLVDIGYNQEVPEGLTIKHIINNISQAVLNKTTIINVSSELHKILKDEPIDKFDRLSGELCVLYFVNGKTVDRGDRSIFTELVEKAASYVMNPSVLYNIKPIVPSESRTRGTRTYDFTDKIIRHLNCPEWSVDGHWRQLSSGKRVWIKGHRKTWGFV